MSNIEIPVDYSQVSKQQYECNSYKKENIIEGEIDLGDVIHTREMVQEITKISLHIQGNIEGYIDMSYGKKAKVLSQLYGRIEYILSDTCFKVYQFKWSKITLINVPKDFKCHKKYQVESVIEEAIGQQIGSETLYIGCGYCSYLGI